MVARVRSWRFEREPWQTCYNDNCTFNNLKLINSWLICLNFRTFNSYTCLQFFYNVFTTHMLKTFTLRLLALLLTIINYLLGWISISLHNKHNFLWAPAHYFEGIWKRRKFRSESASNVFHSRLEEFKNATIIGHSGKLLGKVTWLTWIHCCLKASFSKCFPSTRKRKASFLKFLQFAGRLRKVPFSLRISVDSGPNRKNKVSFSSFSLYCERWL